MTTAEGTIVSAASNARAAVRSTTGPVFSDRGLDMRQPRFATRDTFMQHWGSWITGEEVYSFSSYQRSLECEPYQVFMCDVGIYLELHPESHEFVPVVWPIFARFPGHWLAENHFEQVKTFLRNTFNHMQFSFLENANAYELYWRGLFLSVNTERSPQINLSLWFEATVGLYLAHHSDDLAF